MTPRLPSNFDFDEDEEREMRMEAIRHRKRKNKLIAHPDCRDPDHPGCKHCEKENDEVDSEE